MTLYLDMKYAIIPACSALILAGCTAVGPDFQKPDQVKAQNWTLSQAGLYKTTEINSRWWRTFEDPLLRKLVESALRSNNDLAQAGARVREARALREVAASTLFPDIGTSASALKETISENGRIPAGAIPAIPKRRNVFESGFDASWELDVFGGNRRQVEAADARMAGVEEGRRSIQLSVVAESARNYLELRGLQRQIAII